MDFGKRLKSCPKVFGTNYFLKDKDGKYLNGILDKLCWVVWAEGRTRNDYKAIETPIGYVPLYSDLKLLFKQYLNKDYKEADYIKQFSIRTKKLLEKLDRIESMYKKEKDVPQFFWDMLNDQRKSLINLKNEYNMAVSDYDGTTADQTHGIPERNQQPDRHADHWNTGKGCHFKGNSQSAKNAGRRHYSRSRQYR